MSNLDDPCAGEPISNIPLRIGAIFVILITSLLGTLFPIASLRLPYLHHPIPGTFFEFSKFFSSGIILSTGLIHLLSPAADEELSPSNTLAQGGCLPNGWGSYPFAYAICLVSLWTCFVGQVVVGRWAEGRGRRGLEGQEGGSYSPRRGSRIDVEQGGGEKSPTPEGEKEQPSFDQKQEEKPNLGEKDLRRAATVSSGEDSLAWRDAQEENSMGAQLLSVLMLEFGIVFHSVIIGIDLAVTGAGFQVLFIVIVFHQMFEGLGVGTRLAFLRLPPSYAWLPYFGALLYAIVTPLGMIIGLAVRSHLSMSSAAASLASGILDSVSAGILIYAATVQLMAAEFIQSRRWLVCSWGRLWFAVGSFGAGAGVMALLAKWA